MDDTISTPSDVLNNYFSKVGTLWLSVLTDQNSPRQYGLNGPKFTGKDIYLAIKNKDYSVEEAIEAATDNIKKIFDDIMAADVNAPLAPPAPTP